MRQLYMHDATKYDKEWEDFVMKTPKPQIIEHLKKLSLDNIRMHAVHDRRMEVV